MLGASIVPGGGSVLRRRSGFKVDPSGRRRTARVLGYTHGLQWRASHGRGEAAARGSPEEEPAAHGQVRLLCCVYKPSIYVNFIQLCVHLFRLHPRILVFIWKCATTFIYVLFTYAVSSRLCPKQQLLRRLPQELSGSRMTRERRVVVRQVRRDLGRARWAGGSEYTSNLVGIKLISLL